MGIGFFRFVTQFTRWTDRRTDRQTNRQTFRSWLRPRCIQCSA